MYDLDDYITNEADKTGQVGWGAADIAVQTLGNLHCGMILLR